MELVFHLNRPAPAGGLRVLVASTHTAGVHLPAQLTIPAGAQRLSLAVSTSSVNEATTFAITAMERTADGKPTRFNRKASLTIQPD